MTPTAGASATMSAPPDPETASPAPSRASARSDRQMHRRVRWAMYLTFLALACATAFQGWSIVQLEHQRAADNAVVDGAALLRVQAQKIARFAAMALLPGTTREAALGELESTLSDAGEAAIALQRLLSAHRAGGVAETLRGAVEAWEAARERMWYRAHGLLRVTERWAARPADRSAEDEVTAAVLAVQADADRAAAAGRALESLLRTEADARGAQIEHAATLLVLLLLLVLAVLALAVVEPTARAVRRQVRTLETQALDLRRLALVAENTAALVVVSDRDGRALWVNPAFTRTTGWSAKEACARAWTSRNGSRTSKGPSALRTLAFGSMSGSGATSISSLRFG